MIDVLLGAAIGVVRGVVVKDKIVPNPLQSTVESLIRQLMSVQEENNRLKNETTSLKDELAKSVANQKAMTDKIRQREDTADDMEDKVADLQKEGRRLRDENIRLRQELDELKMQYTARKQELESLQEKYYNLKDK